MNLGSCVPAPDRRDFLIGRVRMAVGVFECADFAALESFSEIEILQRGIDDQIRMVVAHVRAPPIRTDILKLQTVRGPRHHDVTTTFKNSDCHTRLRSTTNITRLTASSTARSGTPRGKRWRHRQHLRPASSRQPAASGNVIGKVAVLESARPIPCLCRDHSDNASPRRA